MFFTQPLNTVQTILSMKGVHTRVAGRVWLGAAGGDPCYGEQRRPSSLVAEPASPALGLERRQDAAQAATRPQRM